jgi:hypothetical protein
MAKAAYTLELALAYNTWTDVTGDWLVDEPLSIERGIAPGERVAGVGRLACRLHSPDGRYAPGHSGCLSGFEAGAGIRLRASDGTETWTLFCGEIAEIVPAPDETVGIAAVDGMDALQRVRVGAFPLRIDVTPGDLIEQLVSRRPGGWAIRRRARWAKALRSPARIPASIWTRARAFSPGRATPGRSRCPSARRWKRSAPAKAASLPSQRTAPRSSGDATPARRGSIPTWRWQAG